MDQDSDLTEKALESVDEQVTANEDDEKKYKISPSKKDKIQSIVDKIDRYDSLDEFIDESIDNTIDFWLHPETMNMQIKNVQQIIKKKLLTEGLQENQEIFIIHY